MPRKGHRQPKHIAGNLEDPRALGTLLRAYLSFLEMRNFAHGTIHKRRCHLNQFIQWSAERSLHHAVEITRPILERYQRQLYHQRDRQGNRLSFNNQHNRLCSLRAWFKWLARQRHVLHNPASELELPKLAHRLPKHVLNQSEAEEILHGADVREPFGLRDRAMLETLYSTGMRRMELAGLQLPDLDAERGVLTIRQGKGKKDRVIPIGDRALAWTIKYREEVRPQLLVNETETTLFLTRYGLPFSGSSLSALVREYVDNADLGKTGSCHLFRHTMATLMLENGCDVRYIQSMLGHANLETTQIYTQVSIRKLKQVHDNTHPAKLNWKHPRPDDSTDSGDDAKPGDNSNPGDR